MELRSVLTIEVLIVISSWLKTQKGTYRMNGWRFAFFQSSFHQQSQDRSLFCVVKVRMTFSWNEELRASRTIWWTIYLRQYWQIGLNVPARDLIYSTWRMRIPECITILCHSSDAIHSNPGGIQGHNVALYSTFAEGKFYTAHVNNINNTSRFGIKARWNRRSW